MARRLESGDPCGAAEAAARLRVGVTDAINAGKVPDVYLEDLSGLANEIELETPECVEPAPPPDDDGEDGDGEDDENGRGNGKGKGNGNSKGKGKHEDDD